MSLIIGPWLVDASVATRFLLICLFLLVVVVVPVFVDNLFTLSASDEVYPPPNSVRLLPTTCSLYCSSYDNSNVSTKANVTHGQSHTCLTTKADVTQSRTLSVPACVDGCSLSTRQRNAAKLSAVRLKNEKKLSAMRLKPWTSSRQNSEVTDRETLSHLAKQRSCSNVSAAGCGNVVVSDVKLRLAEMLGK